MGIPVLRGEAFSRRRDDGRDVVISKALANRIWPDDNLVGKHLRFSGEEPDAWRTIRGVVGGVRHQTTTPIESTV